VRNETIEVVENWILKICNFFYIIEKGITAKRAWRRQQEDKRPKSFGKGCTK